MAVNTLPPGWSADQLAALNELAELRNLWQLVKDLIAATNDTSPEAVRVRADVLDLARACWTRVKTFPPPPA